MRITFIRPNIGRLPDGPYLDEGRMEPLPLGLLAALTPPDVECALHDDRVESIPYEEPTDLVAITTEIYTARRAYEISAEYRRRGVPVILGGFHPTLLPEECAKHADSIFIGEAEPLWAQVVEDARRGRLRRVYRARADTPQPQGLRPRRDLFRGKRYLPITLMQFGRGCRFHCTFCAINGYFGGRHATRPVREVLAEIESQDRRLIFFVDDNFVCDRAAAKRFLRELVPMRVRWVSQGAIDMTEDPELMDLMEASGCLGHVIGFESIRPESLRSMAKRSNLGAGPWDRYGAACGILRKHHLQTWAAFTLGHDDDTKESIRETLDFALHQKFAFAAFNILMPYPGTPLHERLAAEGRLLYGGRWWLHSDYRFNHAAFVPSRMTPDELTAAAFECRERWNRTGAILRRFWDFSTHLSSFERAAVYLSYTRLYARETLRKQGMLLGRSRDTTGPGDAAGAPAPGPPAPGPPADTVPGRAP